MKPRITPKNKNWSRWTCSKNKQGSFISEMKRALLSAYFGMLMNDSVVKLMVCITSGVSLWYKPCWTCSLKKASFWRFCDILYMCYYIIQNLIMGTILNLAIYMFVKVEINNVTSFCNIISLSHHQGNLKAIGFCQGLDNGVTWIFI